MSSAAMMKKPNEATQSGAAAPNSQAEPPHRLVHCVKLGEELEALPKSPFRGELGQRIFENVSKQAWQQWINHSKMLINEFRLDLVSEQGQRVWMAECERYFFGEGSELPPDYRPQE
jgi:Fe-S cluster biosynthesis and repair protein YggX